MKAPERLIAQHQKASILLPGILDSQYPELQAASIAYSEAELPKQVGAQETLRQIPLAGSNSDFFRLFLAHQEPLDFCVLDP